MLAEFSGVLDLEYPPADGVGGGTKNISNRMSIYSMSRNNILLKDFIKNIIQSKNLECEDFGM